MNIFTSIWNSINGGATAISDTAGALVAFFTAVTDYTMWRSLGWLLLGVIMIAAGVYVWGKTVALPQAGTIISQVK